MQVEDLYSEQTCVAMWLNDAATSSKLYGAFLPLYFTALLHLQNCCHLEMQIDVCNALWQ